MTSTNINIDLEEILSSNFDPSDLTKQQLRSILSEYGELSYEELPPITSKKEVYLDYFKSNITNRKKSILNKLKRASKTEKDLDTLDTEDQDSENDDIDHRKSKTSKSQNASSQNASAKRKTRRQSTSAASVKSSPKSPSQSSSPRPASSFALSQMKKKVEFDLSSGYFSDENPFQSPSSTIETVIIKSPSTTSSRRKSSPAITDLTSTTSTTRRTPRGTKSLLAVEGTKSHSHSDVEPSFISPNLKRRSTKINEKAKKGDDEKKGIESLYNVVESPKSTSPKIVAKRQDERSLSPTKSRRSSSVSSGADLDDTSPIKIFSKATPSPSQKRHSSQEQPSSLYPAISTPTKSSPKTGGSKRSIETMESSSPIGSLSAPTSIRRTAGSHFYNPLYKDRSISLSSSSDKRSTKSLWIFSLILFCLLGSLIAFYLNYFSNVRLCRPKSSPGTTTSGHIPISQLLSAPWKYYYSLWKGGKSVKDRFCWPCPPYADCRLNGSTGEVLINCHDGFKLGPLGGGFLGPTCRPDPKLISTVDALAYQIDKFLAEKIGDAYCWSSSPLVSSTGSYELPQVIANTKDIPDQVKEKSTFKSTELMDIFKDRPGPWNNGVPNQFDKYFNHVINRFSTRLGKFSQDYHVFVEKHHSVDDKSHHHGIMYRLTSKQPSYSFTCRGKFFLMNVCKDHLWHMFVGFALLMMIVYIKNSRRRKAARKALVSIVRDDIIDKLVEQESLNRSSPITFPSTVPVNQLRDHLLSFIKESENEKKAIWKEVIGIIHKNSSIRESMTTLKGEQHRVWEWIGPEVLSPSKRRHVEGST